MEQKKINPRNILVGEVVSDKMDKTVVVKVTRSVKHPHVKKIVHKTKKYKVHDTDNQARVGDTVEFYEGRPIAKTKYMYLARIIRSSVR